MVDEKDEEELTEADRAAIVKNLEGSLKDPSHGAATRSVVQEAIQKGQTAMRMIDAALRRYDGNHARSAMG